MHGNRRKGLPKYLWTKVKVNTTTYVTNKNPAISNNGMSQKHGYNGKIPNINHLIIFGNLAHVYISNTKRNKVEFKSIQYTMVGYDGNETLTHVLN
jgi:hypothetical protein